MTQELFNEFLKQCDDYRTDGWANGIAYYFKRNKEWFGFAVDTRGAAPVIFFLDPKFLV